MSQTPPSRPVPATGADGTKAPPPRPGESVRRELAAILVLYVLLAAIPLVMGFSCGGAAT